MAVDFSGVQVGDRVKLSRKNGDEYTFTVEQNHGHCIRSRSDVVYGSEWDSLEILAKSLPTVNGSVIRSRVSAQQYVRVNETWMSVRNGGRVTMKNSDTEHWEILFVPGERESN